jgi:hypothetical protein
MRADKKNDPHPAKGGYRGKVFPLSPGKTDEDETSEPYQYKGLGD